MFPFWKCQTHKCSEIRVKWKQALHLYWYHQHPHPHLQESKNHAYSWSCVEQEFFWSSEPKLVRRGEVTFRKHYLHNCRYLHIPIVNLRNVEDNAENGNILLVNLAMIECDVLSRPIILAISHTDVVISGNVVISIWNALWWHLKISWTFKNSDTGFQYTTHCFYHQKYHYASFDSAASILFWWACFWSWQTGNICKFCWSHVGILQ